MLFAHELLYIVGFDLFQAQFCAAKPPKMLASSYFNGILLIISLTYVRSLYMSFRVATPRPNYRLNILQELRIEKFVEFHVCVTPNLNRQLNALSVCEI